MLGPTLVLDDDTEDGVVPVCSIAFRTVAMSILNA